MAAATAAEGMEGSSMNRGSVTKEPNPTEPSKESNPPGPRLWVMGGLSRQAERKAHVVCIGVCVMGYVRA
jgi:hypothetical protein